MSLKQPPRDGGQDKEESRARDPQSQDLEVHRREVLGGFLEDGPELMGFELHAHEQGYLLGDDQQTDGRQHALDGGRREDGAEAGHLQPGENQLHQAGEANGHQHERVTRLQHFGLAGSAPRSTLPSLIMPANNAGARPAAGPLIVTYDPPRNGSTKPAMIADMIPHIGGAPEVMAIPIENGSEIIDTMNPERRS